MTEGFSTFLMDAKLFVFRLFIENLGNLKAIESFSTSRQLKKLCDGETDRLQNCFPIGHNNWLNILVVLGLFKLALCFESSCCDSFYSVLRIIAHNNSYNTTDCFFLPSLKDVVV